MAYSGSSVAAAPVQRKHGVISNIGGQASAAAFNLQSRFASNIMAANWQRRNNNVAWLRIMATYISISIGSSSGNGGMRAAPRNAQT